MRRASISTTLIFSGSLIVLSGCRQDTKSPVAEVRDTKSPVGDDRKPEPSPITLLPKAIEAIRRTAGGQVGNKKYWVRVEVQMAGGPETLKHSVDIELDPPRPRDRVFEAGGLSVVVLADQTDMLKGCTVDYGEKDGQIGFKITNPQFEGKDQEKWIREFQKRRNN